MVKKYNKITTGFIIQKYVILSNGTQVCQSQKFVDGDEVQYEDLYGEYFEVDTTKEVYCPFDMVQPKTIPTNGLKFTCPECGSHRLECCEDGPYVSEVLSIDDEDDFDYGEIDASGMIDRFQCLNCGFILSREDKSAIDDIEEIVEWIKKN